MKKYKNLCTDALKECEQLKKKCQELDAANQRNLEQSSQIMARNEDAQQIKELRDDLLKQRKLNMEITQKYEAQYSSIQASLQASEMNGQKLQRQLDENLK